MNIIQRRNWDAFEALRDFQTELDRFFAAPSAQAGGLQSPDVEITEKEHEYVVHADLPGMAKEDFEITVEGNRFILRGERKEAKKEERKGYHYSERRYGSFARGFQLPSEVDSEKVKAVYKNGVLEVVLPKTIKEKSKKIDVQVN